MAVVRTKPQVQATSSPGSGTLTSVVQSLREAGMDSFPLQVYEVAELLGLEVVEELMDDDISGYLEFRKGRWIVGVNALHHPNRQRFTIAHELAHYVLHRNSESKFVDSTFARRQADKFIPMENEADRFAAELLMPGELVNNYIKNGITSLESLAEKFRVSTLAMKFRVKSLGYGVR